MATWRDLFPWIEGRLDGDWQAEVSAASEEERADTVRRCADYAKKHLQYATLEQLMPTLPGELEIDSIDLPSRAANVLRQRYRRFRDL
ncbi:MAG: hypothetical protein Q4P33_08160, partial [Flaviflexus sp.]|nr:hypothetical protein [Flaviflexus sp.]